MIRNPDATVYVYRHRETGAITALYSDAALDMLHNADYKHVATLEPRMWIERHFDDAVKEREACAKLCESLFDMDDDSCSKAEQCAAAIRVRSQA